MNTESPPRVLTCAYNNRRRNRTHPLTHPNIILDDDDNNNNNNNMNVQALKPNKSITPSKIRKNSVIKLSSENGGLENIGDWSTHLSKGSTHEKASKISAQESRDDEELSNEQPSIFRDMGDFDDRDGMMVLKRANPVYDSDDDEDDIVPPKRRRTLDGNTTLQWGEQLEETSNALSSIFLLRE